MIAPQKTTFPSSSSKFHAFLLPFSPSPDVFVQKVQPETRPFRLPFTSSPLPRAPRQKSLLPTLAEFQRSRPKRDQRLLGAETSGRSQWRHGAARGRPEIHSKFSLVQPSTARAGESLEDNPLKCQAKVVQKVITGRNSGCSDRPHPSFPFYPYQ